MDNRETDLDILDTAVTLAEAWRVLLIVPFMAAVLTVGILFFMKPQYVSNAAVLMTLPPDVLTSRATLDAVVTKLGLQETYGPEMDVAADAVRRRITLTKSPSRDGDPATLVTIEAKFPSPELSHNVLESMLDEVRKQSVPRLSERERLESKISTLKSAISALQDYSGTLQKAEGSPGTPLEEEAFARSLSTIVNTIVAKQDDLRFAEAALTGMGPEAIVSEPTIPDRPASKGTAVFSIIAAVTAGLGTLAFIFIRAAFRRAGTTSVGSQKLHKIRTAFRLRQST